MGAHIYKFTMHQFIQAKTSFNKNICILFIEQVYTCSQYIILDLLRINDSDHIVHSDHECKPIHDAPSP